MSDKETEKLKAAGDDEKSKLPKRAKSGRPALDATWPEVVDADESDWPPLVVVKGKPAP